MKKINFLYFYILKLRIVNVLAEETSAKKPQHFAKSSNIYLGLRDIFNNPINKNSFECLLALGKTLFPRQIALNFWTSVLIY